MTADTAPMGAVLMATHHLLGLSGKVVPWLGPRVFRAGELRLLSGEREKVGLGHGGWASIPALGRLDQVRSEFLRCPGCTFFFFFLVKGRLLFLLMGF